MARKKKEDEFFVEVIVAARVVQVTDSDDNESGSKKRKRKGKKTEPKPPKATWEYLVKWFNFDDSENSWEPASGLASCDRLLSSFWAEVEGPDDKDFFIGDTVRPSDKWIESEKKYFANEQKAARLAKEGNSKAKEGASSKKNKKASTKEKSKEKEEPAPPKRSTSLKSERRTKKPRVIETDSESGSDSDTPLAKKRKRTHNGENPIEEISTSADEVLREQTPPPRPKFLKTKKPSEERESDAVPASTVATVEPTSPNSLFSDTGHSPVLAAVPNVPIAPSFPPPIPVSHNPPVSLVPPRTSLTIPTLPTRVKAPPNPHTRLAAMPQDAGPSNAGISTKQRLAQGALAFTLPKNMTSTATKPKGPPLSPVRTGSSSVMTTGFKKTSQISPVFYPHDQTLASLNAPPASPPLSTAPPDMEMVDSPVAIDPGHSFSSETFGSAYRAQQTQVDNFLHSIMPPQMAGPLEPNPDIPIERHPPIPTLPSKVPALPSRNVKTFKWEGNLLVTSTADATDTTFRIVLEDESELKMTGFSFSILLSSLSQLDIRLLYHVHDLPSIIPACKAPDQFAKVSLQSVEDKKPWVTFLRYLVKSKKVVLIPLRLDGNVVAHLLLASSKLSLPSSLKIPPKIKGPDNLAAFILPWALTPPQIATESRVEITKLPITKSKFQVSLSKRVDGVSELRRAEMFKRSLKSRPLFHEAIRILNFPPKVYDYLQQTNRPWAICFNNPGHSKNDELEVAMMRSILSRIKEEAMISQKEDPSNKNKYPVLREARSPEFAQMVFIHVGALRNLNKLPWLRDRILSPEYVRFYAFGSHPSVYSHFWGVQEIYPCGGVVTFLPSSFLLYPYEMMQVIKKINEHPFWTAYILPSVMGMIAEVSGMNAGLTPSDSLHSYLLKAIEDGQIALIEAPPDNKHCYGEPTSDLRHRWFHDYFSGLPPSEQDALSLARSAFNSKTANIPKSQWPALMEREVAGDVTRMQRQPVFMLDYRRYIVLTGTAVPRQDSLEWLLPSDFGFGDAFLRDDS